MRGSDPDLAARLARFERFAARGAVGGETSSSAPRPGAALAGLSEKGVDGARAELAALDAALGAAMTSAALEGRAGCLAASAAALAGSADLAAARALYVDGEALGVALKRLVAAAGGAGGGDGPATPEPGWRGPAPDDCKEDGGDAAQTSSAAAAAAWADALDAVDDAVAVGDAEAALACLREAEGLLEEEDGRGGPPAAIPFGGGGDRGRGSPLSDDDDGPPSSAASYSSSSGPTPPPSPRPGHRSGRPLQLAARRAAVAGVAERGVARAVARALPPGGVVAAGATPSPAAAPAAAVLAVLAGPAAAVDALLAAHASRLAAEQAALTSPSARASPAGAADPAGVDLAAALAQALAVRVGVAAADVDALVGGGGGLKDAAAVPTAAALLVDWAAGCAGRTGVTIRRRVLAPLAGPAGLAPASAAAAAATAQAAAVAALTGLSLAPRLARELAPAVGRVWDDEVARLSAALRKKGGAGGGGGRAAPLPPACSGPGWDRLATRFPSAVTLLSAVREAAAALVLLAPSPPTAAALREGLAALFQAWLDGVGGQGEGVAEAAAALASWYLPEAVGGATSAALGGDAVGGEGLARLAAAAGRA